MEYAIITGAARNIGKGIAAELLAAGYGCVLVDKDAEALRSTYTELKKRGECREYVLDVSDIAAIDGFYEWLETEGIRPAVLVNNAGYESHAGVLGLDPDEVTKSSDTNLKGPFYLTSRFAESLTHAKQPGNVVFISSTHSNIMRGNPLYSASKAAINMFVVEAALELASFGIRVNAVSPGPVKDLEQREANHYVPLGYTIEPHDIGAAVAFLVSEKARFITGQTLTVDGGFSLAHTHYWKARGRL